MEFQIKGIMNSVGEEFFSFAQAAGILNIDQCHLYKALENVDFGKAHWKNRKVKIKILPIKVVRELIKVTENIKWQNLSYKLQIKTIRESVKNLANSQKKENTVKTQTEDIKKLAQRLLSLLG